MDDFCFSDTDYFSSTRSLPSFEGVGFLDNRLDRDTEHRTETCLDDNLAHKQAGLYLLSGDTLLLKETETGGRHQAIFSLEDAKALGADLDCAILLGTDPAEADAPRLAAPLTEDAVTRLEGEKGQASLELMSIRHVGLNGLLPPDQLGAVAQARSLLTWHANHVYCANCGSKTVVSLGGARRDCPSCSAMHFPRTDPAVIMLVLHRDEEGVERCLLAHHTRFSGPMYTTLAGYLEQGETIEAAVRREVFEESAIRVGAVRYMASQPWPFPSSLMIGCYAEALSTEITVDPTELTDARWFTRQDVRTLMSRHVGAEEPHIPGRFSIAAWLIGGWVEMGD
ncbi:NAD(+) diphosphatase [uncultured Cohaesibacter sp.]|uniref:NAD(+) diphosphatase n=1 Tax=uncultured Cohaesibacter sp. TaxID=1002546 RepID=UPI00292D53CE|nr:NAD(+) diphosphatase [uncultured Cohaesibacter sp.]